MFFPYNSYRLNDGRYKNAQLLTSGHFNPEGTRHELHRVWTIEATEREGSRHSFGKRVFYVDEDSWNVALVENYDREGRLWRFQEGHLLPFYDSQSANTFPSLTYDLKDGGLPRRAPDVRRNAAALQHSARRPGFPAGVGQTQLYEVILDGDDTAFAKAFDAHGSHIESLPWPNAVWEPPHDPLGTQPRFAPLWLAALAHRSFLRPE